MTNQTNLEVHPHDRAVQLREVLVNYMRGTLAPAAQLVALEASDAPLIVKQGGRVGWFRLKDVVPQLGASHDRFYVSISAKSEDGEPQHHDLGFDTAGNPDFTFLPHV